jgi:hypothetical protein
LVGLASIGFSLWCLYDGIVKYPEQRDRALKHHELKEAGPPDEWEAKWTAYAAEQGWSPLDPGEPKTEYDFYMQYGMAGMAASVGLIFLTILLLNRGRWIEADDSGLATGRGQKCGYDGITLLNKKKWRNKGIAVVRYEEQGARGKIVLDDCKYDPDATETILREVEDHLTDEQIIGGRAEPPVNEEGDEEYYDESQDDAETPSAEGDEESPHSG